MNLLPRYVEVIDGIVMNSLQTSAPTPVEPFYRCHCEPELGHTWHPNNIPTAEATDSAPERALSLDEWIVLHTGTDHKVTKHQMVPIGRRTDIKPLWKFDAATQTFSE